MNETEINQKIKNAFHEPHAPEALIDSVIARAKAITMGLQAQQQLQTAAPEDCRDLIALSLIGQLAAVSELPNHIPPQELAQQLRQSPVFTQAMQGGSIMERLQSGELLRQIAEKAGAPELSGQQSRSISREVAPQQMETPHIKGPQKGI